MENARNGGIKAHTIEEFHMHTIPSTLRKTRLALIRDIKKMISPHLRDSGYVTAINPKTGILAGSRPLKIWVGYDRMNKPKTWKINGYVLDEIEGITELGPITDCYMAIVTTYWNGIPVEDLAKLRDWAIKTMPGQTEEVREAA